MYTLLIKRYNRYMSFNTVEELKDETARYFTNSEKSIVEKLTTFNLSNADSYGMVKNDYKDFSTTYCR